MLKTGKEIPCHWCKKMFYLPQWKINAGGKYCSHRCYSLARKAGFYTPPWLGKKRDKEMVKRTAQKLKKGYASGKYVAWCKGKKLTKKHKKHLSVARKAVIASGNMVGKNHPNWKGGKHHSHDGYYKVNTGANKQQYEHIVIMEKHIGRKLLKNEVVHHIDFNPSNNKINNLLLTTHGKHIWIHRRHNMKS